jgi:hypothetical protein
MSSAPRAALQRPVRLEIEASCAACHRPVGFCAPLLRLACSACGESVELASTTWAQLFGEIDEKSFDLPDSDPDTRVAEQATAEGKLTARYALGAPRCDKCKCEIMLVEPGTDDSLECAQCSTKTTTFPAPGWLRTELPTAMQLYAASREAEARAGWFWITFQGTPPARREHHQVAIQAAIGGGPDRGAVPVSVRAPPQSRHRWEWYAVIAIVVLIVIAVRQCGRRAAGTPESDRDNAVEPAQ